MMMWMQMMTLIGVRMTRNAGGGGGRNAHGIQRETFGIHAVHVMHTEGGS